MRDHDAFLERALLEEGRIGERELAEARRYGAEHGVDLVDALIGSQTLDSREVALARARVYESVYVDLSAFEPCYANTRLVPRNIAERHCAFPLFLIDGVLTLAIDDPLNLEAVDQVRQLVKCEVDPVHAQRRQIRALIARAYNLGHESAADGAGERGAEAEAEGDAVSRPVITLVNQLLAEAVEHHASDIHINPDEHQLRLRYRIDGVLQERQSPPLTMHTGIVQRLKVMARLDLTQTRRPQDGKFRFRHGGQHIDVRISTVPTVCGENVVLRLLSGARTFRDFHELGMPAEMTRELEELIGRPNGMLLVTGPTGCGKTTTLYTALSKLNEPSRNVMTIEDPVEIRLPYVRQIQVNPEIGLTFAQALRSMLRQDPDVMLVGEVRDRETAAIAVQAALTGHMVLSTLHTNDAVGAVARLRDYELPPFAILSAVIGVIAQRLVRRVCSHCAAPTAIDEAMRRRFGLESGEEGFVRGRGCPRCSHTGYRGRIGVYELLRLTGEIRRLIEQDCPTEQLRRAAVEGGMRMMWSDGLAKARLGQTTLEEVAKVAVPVEHDDTAEPLRGLVA